MTAPIFTSTTPLDGKTSEPEEVTLKPSARLVPKRRGQRFRPHGTDSIGVIRSWSAKTVQFNYLHEPSTPHSMGRHEFTARFAAWVPRPEAPKPIRSGQHPGTN
jgi:hypothetical protein